MSPCDPHHPPILQVNDVIGSRLFFLNRKTPQRRVAHRLSFVTSPGDAHFEATVTLDEQTGSASVEGDISRINEYGEQSSCVNEGGLKKFCHCGQ